jgi:hypothetical protein
MMAKILFSELPAKKENECGCTGTHTGSTFISPACISNELTKRSTALDPSGSKDARAIGEKL